MSKFEELHKLKEEMEADNSLPLKKGATKLVFGVGNTSAKILCVGEGPGFNEDKQGEPFVGQAGKLLDKLFPLAGLERKEVFITNVVHHRPPENRDPLPEEISAYGKYLDKIIEIIDPEVIITLGRFSMAKFLPNVFISGVHGKKYALER
jgi:uracil-DNA glycosylase family 4